ncbi:MAG: tetratricopeptide repeat protein [Kiloniellaceae bacterium]|nr:tetratricopeptide repeat protein [Kiloniellaceae bacterium]
MMRRKLSLIVAALGMTLLLGACGTQLEDARSAFGYSGMAGGDPTLSSYEQAKADFAAARYGLAVKRFQMAMAEDPASVEAANGLAATYDQVGRYDLAERFYRRALSMDPNSVQTLNNLGYSMLLQGKPDLALAFFRDAARVAPDSDVIAANAELAVAARMEDRRLDAAAAAAAAKAPPASAQAAEAAAIPALRIVRFNAVEQHLQLQPQQVVMATTEASAMPAVPLLPVETHPLPALPGRPDPSGLAPQPVAVLPSVRVAVSATANDALIAAGPSESGAAVADLTGTIEVSNGTGRRHMAARVRAYLAQLGLTAARLTNADHFAHTTTTITYRPGHRGLAEALSASLPIAPLLQQSVEQAADVRVELGGDLLKFDSGLLQAERNTSHADAV